MLRVTFLQVVLLLILAVSGCTATEGADEPLAPADTDDDAQIYAAAIREIHAFGRASGAPGRPLVYVVSTANDSAMVDAPTAPSRELPVELQKAISDELADEHFELIWIVTIDDAPIDPTNRQIAEGDGIIITLGNIHLQDDGSVQLPFFMACGDLCGIGKIYVLSQSYGVWHVIGSVGPVIAS